MPTVTDDPTTPAWAQALLGPDARVVSVLAGGSSRSTVLVEAPGRARRIVARHDGGAGPLSGTPFTLAREAATYAAVAATGVPVPAVVAVAGDGSAFAVDEVPGRPASDAAALDDYLAAIGRLHAAGTRPAPAGHAGFDAAGAEDIGLWERMAGRLTRPAPVLDAAFAALRRHGAAAPPEVVVCHGDAGAGNYLQDGSTVTGLVDWEMAHTGDPHDDLASVAVRAVLGGIDVGDFRGRLAAHYEPVAGVGFDPRRHQLAVAAVLARMVVSCLCALDHPDPGADRSVQVMGLPVMEVQLVRALAALDGERLDPHPDPPVDLDYASEIAAAVADGLAAAGPAPGAGRRLRYLAGQLGTGLRDAAAGRSGWPGPPGGRSLADLWAAAHGRLAALPGSRRLALAPVPGAA